MVHTGQEDPVDDERPRSIFATLWFRALLVVLVMGAVASVAVPYVLDVVNPPAGSPMLAAPAAPPSPPAESRPLPEPSPPQPAAPGPAPESASTPAASTPTPAPAATDPIAVASTDKPPAPAGQEPARATTEPAPASQPGERPAAADGPWWVQVGAFRDAAAARRLVARLREQNYRVQESVKAPGPATVAAAAAGDTSSDRYSVFVSGLAPAEIRSRLAARGLKADPVAGGAVVQPSLPLRDAVALSRELAAQGLQVQVRRQGGGATPAPAADTPLYRVRVGGFPDRAAALAVARELEFRGYRPFLTRDGS